MNVICVYKISCKDELITNFYVGSTNNLQKTILSHTKNCNNKNNSNTRQVNMLLYIYIRNNGGINNWKFDILEETNLIELKVKEQYWLHILKPTLNVFPLNPSFYWNSLDNGTV